MCVVLAELGALLLSKTPTSNLRPGPEYHCTDVVAQHISPNYLAGDYLHGPADDEGWDGGRLIRTPGWSTVVIISGTNTNSENLLLYL